MKILLAAWLTVYFGIAVWGKPTDEDLPWWGKALAVGLASAFVIAVLWLFIYVWVWALA